MAAHSRASRRHCFIPFPFISGPFFFYLCIALPPFLSPRLSHRLLGRLALVKPPGKRVVVLCSPLPPFFCLFWVAHMYSHNAQSSRDAMIFEPKKHLVTGATGRVWYLRNRGLLGTGTLMRGCGWWREWSMGGDDDAALDQGRPAKKQFTRRRPSFSVTQKKNPSLCALSDATFRVALARGAMFK